MGLTSTDIADMMESTHAEFDRLKWEDMVSDYRRTIVVKELLGKSEMGVGSECRFNLMTDHNHSARSAALDGTDAAVHANVFTHGEIGWKRIEWSWSVHAQLVSENRTPNQILDYMKSQYLAGKASWTVYAERAMWRVQYDDDAPMGIPYWIVKNATEGFNGGLPSGFTTVGGIDPSEFTKWKNYTAQWTNATSDDLVRKLRRAMEMTDFMTIIDEVPDHKVSRLGLYSVYDGVVAPLEELLESRNDNLKYDLDVMNGKVVVRGIPIVVVPELENDTTYPIYGIPWGKFGFKFLRDWKDRPTKIERHPSQRHVSVEYRDNVFNTYCTSRRHCFVLATGTSMPS